MNESELNNFDYFLQIYKSEKRNNFPWFIWKSWSWSAKQLELFFTISFPTLCFAQSKPSWCKRGKRFVPFARASTSFIVAFSHVARVFDQPANDGTGIRHKHRSMAKKCTAISLQRHFLIRALHSGLARRKGRICHAGSRLKWGLPTMLGDRMRLFETFEIN